MDKMTRYRALVRTYIAEQARFKPGHGEIQPTVVCDERQDRYLLLEIGWSGVRRVHSLILHIHVRDGKIWLEHDGTPPPGTAAELVAAGVPKEDIVLAFQSPSLRSFSGFARV